MPRFIPWDALRKAVCRHPCDALVAELEATRQELANAVALNARLMAEQRDTELQIRDKNLFLKGLSHELRTPLNAIIGFSEVLASASPVCEPARQAEFAGHINRSGRHLLRLINDVIELAKVEAGDHESVPENVDLNELIARVADVLHSPLVRKSLQFSVDVTAELAEIFADPVGLKKTVFSLVSHAIDVAREGAAITVCARPQEAARLRIDVRLSESTEGRLREGLIPSSVPMMLARRWIEAQGGELGRSADADAGTTLWFVLDVAQHPPTALEEKATHPRPSSTSTSE